MIRCALIALCVVAATSAQNQGLLNVNIETGPASSSGRSSSSQQRRGQNIVVGGSASSRGQSNSQGGSSASASASGQGQGGAQQQQGGAQQQQGGAQQQQGGAAQAQQQQTDAERELSRYVRPHGVVYPDIISPGGTPPVQNPGVWDALDSLRGKGALIADEIILILATAVAGTDYPNYADMPETSFNCASVKQGGFYADPETRCQVYHRCDIMGLETSYICPNQTVFNQITLTCDWFFNVNCENAPQFYDYSNARLYHEDWVLLDTPPEKNQNENQNQQKGASNAGSRARVPASRGFRADLTVTNQAQNSQNY